MAVESGVTVTVGHIPRSLLIVPPQKRRDDCTTGFTTERRRFSADWPDGGRVRA